MVKGAMHGVGGMHDYGRVHAGGVCVMGCSLQGMCMVEGVHGRGCA